MRPGRARGAVKAYRANVTGDVASLWYRVLVGYVRMRRLGIHGLFPRHTTP